MRTFLTAAAALVVVSLAACLGASAQQPAQPSTSTMSRPAATPVAKARKVHRRAARTRHRRARYASLSHRMYSPCEIIDGWRAFPTRDRLGYFDTSRVCHRR